LSPAYPIGAFCHSSGLEWAVETGWIYDRASTLSWLETVLRDGAGWNDAVLFTHAHRATQAQNGAQLRAVAELAAAAHPAAERRQEQLSQGTAFRRATVQSGTAPDILRELEADLAYPIAVAVMAAAYAIPATLALTAFLHSSVTNLVSAAQRLVPIGQTDAQMIIAALQATVAAVVRRAAALGDGDPFDSLGSATLLADLAAILHETQYTRLFRT
ncbi:MAG: urease accessory UreF family protein, partial [Hyphomicrobium sp.]|nr:urease accessory UreF family protein [Hyphomicrobium sp.]